MDRLERQRAQGTAPGWALNQATSDDDSENVAACSWTTKIAVKVIDDRGNEVVKVVRVAP